MQRLMGSGVSCASGALAPVGLVVVAVATLSMAASLAWGLTQGELFVLAGFVAGCLAIAGLGGAMTSLSVGGWYQGLSKPPFNPPDQVFAPVWTALFLMMAIAAWRVWQHRESRGRGRALVLFALQLAL